MITSSYCLSRAGGRATLSGRPSSARPKQSMRGGDNGGGNYVGSRTEPPRNIALVYRNATVFLSLVLASAGRQFAIISDAWFLPSRRESNRTRNFDLLAGLWREPIDARNSTNCNGTKLRHHVNAPILSLELGNSHLRPTVQNDTRRKSISVVPCCKLRFCSRIYVKFVLFYAGLHTLVPSRFAKPTETILRYTALR